MCSVCRGHSIDTLVELILYEYFDPDLLARIYTNTRPPHTSYTFTVDERNCMFRLFYLIRRDVSDFKGKNRKHYLRTIRQGFGSPGHPGKPRE